MDHRFAASGALGELAQRGLLAHGKEPNKKCCPDVHGKL